MRQNITEEMIKQLYNGINTPEYDASGEVFAKIKRARPRRRVRFTLIAAAVVIAAASLISAGRLALASSFDFFGNRTDHYDDYGYRLFGERDEEKIAYENSLVEKYKDHLVISIKDGEKGVSKYNGSGTHDFSFAETDYNAAVRRIGSATYRIPDYVPEGYIFEEMGYTLYADESCLGRDPVFSEEKFGARYEVYEIPEEMQDNLRYTWIRYKTGGAENLPDDDMLYIYADLTFKLSETSTISFTSGPDSTAETIEVKGFKHAVMVTDSNKSGKEIYTLHLYNENTSPESYYNSLAFNKDYYEWSVGMPNFSPMIKSGAISYMLTSNNLPKEELIKTAESLIK